MKKIKKNTIYDTLISILKGKVTNEIPEKELFEISIKEGVNNYVRFILKKSGISSELFEFEYSRSKKKHRKNLMFLKKIPGEFILIKGMAIAQMYYGDITARHPGDIDILVPQEDYQKFIDFFLSLNMHEVKLSGIKKRIGHSRQFISEDGISCGLHMYLCDRLFADITFKDVKSRKVELKLNKDRVVVKTLQDDWTIINLSLHLFQHAFPFRIFLDLKNVLNKLEKEKKITDTLNSAVQIARKFGVERELKISIRATEKLFGDTNQHTTNIMKTNVIDEFLSSFVSSTKFLDLRKNLFMIPYMDKVFSLSIARKIPLRKISSILPILPKEFIKRLKGEYPITR